MAITPEVFNSGGDVLAVELHSVISLCWEKRCIPSAFKDANIITLFKNKRSRHECNNYRGISLLSIAGKVFAKVLLPRLEILADRVLPESQCGFCSLRSTVDMVFSLKQLQ